jgi:hypothetical protein
MILRYQNLIFIIVLINIIKVNSKAWRLHGGGNSRHAEIWPLAISSPENGLTDDINESSDDLISEQLNTIVTPPGVEDELSAFNLERRSRSLTGKNISNMKFQKKSQFMFYFRFQKKEGYRNIIHLELPLIW